MHTRLLAAAAALLFTAFPLSLAQAHDHEGWSGRGYLHELRAACDWGDRRACIRLGREIEQRREARRGWTAPPPPPWPRDPWRDPRWEPYRRW